MPDSIKEILIMPKQYIIELCAISHEALAAPIKISPINEVTGLDGRVFDIDGTNMLKRLTETGLELVLNVAHQYDGKAAGWFTDFELKADGVYATLTLNDWGKELIESKSYKYLSPEYFIDWNTNEVHRIVGVGLVNQPNLLNDALNHINNDATPSDQTEGNAMGDTTKTPEEQIADLQNTVTKLTAENKTQSEQISANKIDTAINSGKLAPAKRDFALQLENNALDNYLTVEAQTFQKIDNNQIDQNEQDNDTNSDCPVMAQLGL